MRLTDEENSAESGIDVVASPPGKKLQNVLLLSGGEKAMTALALLVGIFQYQPSPFCILDEVDAPLDEAHIGRFTELVKEMAVQTQFVLITHSKKTMSIAPVLYGVTMQGREFRSWCRQIGVAVEVRPVSQRNLCVACDRTNEVEASLSFPALPRNSLGPEFSGTVGVLRLRGRFASESAHAQDDRPTASACTPLYETAATLRVSTVSPFSTNACIQPSTRVHPWSDRGLRPVVRQSLRDEIFSSVPVPIFWGPRCCKP